MPVLAGILLPVHASSRTSRIRKCSWFADQPSWNESSQVAFAHQFLNWFPHQTDRQTLGLAHRRQQECAAGLGAGLGPAVLEGLMLG